jgi:hypothetical protein
VVQQPLLQLLQQQQARQLPTLIAIQLLLHAEQKLCSH